MELDKEVGGVLVMLLEPRVVEAMVEDIEDEEDDVEGEATSDRVGAGGAGGGLWARADFFSAWRTTSPAGVLYGERPLDTLGILELRPGTEPLGPLWKCESDVDPVSRDMCIWAK